MNDLDIKISTEDLSSQTLKFLGPGIMILSMGIFLYFLIASNFHMHYLIAIICFLLAFVGVFLWLISSLRHSEKAAELTFSRTSQQVTRFGWLALGTLYMSGISFTVGLIFIAQQNDLWRFSVIFFSVSIISLLICMYGLMARKSIKQCYELKKQQQEILEAMNDLKVKEMKNISGGALLA